MTAPASGLVDATGRPISPVDVARIKARASLGDTNNAWAYDAQTPSSQEFGADWLPWVRSPDTEINYDRDRVVARTRDVYRNDGWAHGGIVTRILDAAIGSNFAPIPKPNWQALSKYSSAFDATWATEFAKWVRSEWSLWADDLNFHSDATRTLTMTQQLYLAFSHYLIDGEALGAVLWAPERVGLGAARYSTVHQTIDPDRLSNPYQAVDTHDRRGGVQIDDLGAPLGYHIRKGHQNDWYDAVRSMQWEFFPRETPWGRPIILHFFDRERADQHRGVSLMTSVLPRFKMLSKYDAVSLQAAVLRTVVGFFVKSPFDPEQVRAAIDAGGEGDVGVEDAWTGLMGDRLAWNARHGVSVGGVRLPLLAPGESIETASAGNHADDYDQFQAVFMRSLAAATGQSYEEVTGDFRHTNYSSFRGATEQAWRTLKRRRENFTPRYATPLYAAWLEEALDGHLKDVLPRNAPPFIEMRSAYGRAEWIGPGRGVIDPVKEPQGAVLQLDAGLTTLADQTRMISGRYWLDVLDEREVEEAEMKKRGLALPDWAGGDDRTATQIAEKPMPD